MTWRSRSLPSAHTNVTCTSPVPRTRPGGTASAGAWVVGLVAVGGVTAGVDGREVSPPLVCPTPTIIRTSTTRAIPPPTPAPTAATRGHQIEIRGGGRRAAPSGSGGGGGGGSGPAPRASAHDS